MFITRGCTHMAVTVVRNKQRGGLCSGGAFNVSTPNATFRRNLGEEPANTRTGSTGALTRAIAESRSPHAFKNFQRCATAAAAPLHMGCTPLMYDGPAESASGGPDSRGRALENSGHQPNSSPQRPEFQRSCRLRPEYACEQSSLSTLQAIR